MNEQAAPPSKGAHALRLAVLATLLGAAAGGLAAFTYLAMIALQQTIWTPVGDARWPILPLVLIGGALVGWTRLQAQGPELEEQLEETRHPNQIQLHMTFWVAIGAIFAVGFGGAIGPEAGIIAVTAQLSAIVAKHLGKTAADRRLLVEAGISGALSGVYGSPAGGPLHAEAAHKAPKPILFLAGLAGFLAFISIAQALHSGSLGMMVMQRYQAEVDIYGIIVAALPALAGACAGVLYLIIRAEVSKRFSTHLPNRFLQPVMAGLGLGLVCTVAPILLFSGHNEIQEMLRLGQEHGALLLVLLGLGKALVCAICIAGHWQGGVIFPMCFAGGSMGAATLFILPGFDPVIGLAAGMTGASTVGMTRPFVAVLVMLFVLGGGLAAPVFVGALIGWSVLRMMPERYVQSAH